MRSLRYSGPLLPAEELSAHWARVHERETFIFSTCEVHYLKALAMALDDDLVALLLLKKLRMATERPPAELPRNVVVMNSLVSFAFDGDERVRRLVHPTVRGTGSLSIGSRLGAGVIGLRVGQSVLWPDERQALRQLHVTAVESRAQKTTGISPAAVSSELKDRRKARDFRSI